MIHESRNIFTKEEVNAFACVCLSVCLLARLLKKCVHGFG